MSEMDRQPIDRRAWVREFFASCREAGERDEPRHHPTIYTTGAHGNWCECSCGWKSRRWQQVGGAHLEFGEHLREAK